MSSWQDTFFKMIGQDIPYTGAEAEKLIDQILTMFKGSISQMLLRENMGLDEVIMLRFREQFGESSEQVSYDLHCERLIINKSGGFDSKFRWVFDVSDLF